VCVCFRDAWAFIRVRVRVRVRVCVRARVLPLCLVYKIAYTVVAVVLPLPHYRSLISSSIKNCCSGVVGNSLGHAVVAQHQVAHRPEDDEEGEEYSRVGPEGQPVALGATLTLKDRRHRYRRRVLALGEFARLRAPVIGN
jgi:hypothetical protein